MTVAYGKLYVKNKTGDIIQIVPDATTSVREYQGATDQNDGISGVVPSATSEQKDRFLKGDGTWCSVDKEVALMSETPTSQNTQTLDNGSIIFQQIAQNDSPPIIHSSGDETIYGTKTFASSINGSITGNAATANQVEHDFTLKIKNGNNEGTSKYTFNGSSDKTLNIAQGDGIVLSTEANNLTISSTGEKTYTLCDNALETLFNGLPPVDAMFEIYRLTVKLYSSYDAPNGGSIYGSENVDYEINPIFEFSAYNMSVPSNVDYEIEGAFDNFDPDLDYDSRRIDGMIIEIETSNYDGGFARVYDNNAEVIETSGGSCGYGDLTMLYTRVGSNFDENTSTESWNYAVECQQYLEYQKHEDYTYQGNPSNVKMTYLDPENPFWNAVQVYDAEFTGTGGSGSGLIPTTDCTKTLEYTLNYRIPVNDLTDSEYDSVGQVLNWKKYPKIIVRFTKTTDEKIHCFLNYITMQNESEEEE